jgi:hypothetical protein
MESQELSIYKNMKNGKIGASYRSANDQNKRNKVPLRSELARNKRNKCSESKSIAIGSQQGRTKVARNPTKPIALSALSRTKPIALSRTKPQVC